MYLKRSAKFHHNIKVNSLQNQEAEKVIRRPAGHQFYKIQVLWPPQQSETLAHTCTLGFLFVFVCLKKKDKKKESSEEGDGGYSKSQAIKLRNSFLMAGKVLYIQLLCVSSVRTWGPRAEAGTKKPIRGCCLTHPSLNSSMN